jgi:hypothetical protein
MTKIPSIALLIAGELLLAYGLSASSSLSSPLNEVVGVTPARSGPWLIACGLLGIATGAAALAHRRAR